MSTLWTGWAYPLALAAIGVFYATLRLRSGRRRQELLDRTGPMVEQWSSRLRHREISVEPSAVTREGVAEIADLLTPESFEALRRATLALSDSIERSYVVAHKKGGTIAYDRLREHAPEAVAFYQSEPLRALISALVGDPVYVTPVNDQSSCSLLIYSSEGDHIGWHYDHNFYRGRHFTVLLSIENRGSGAMGLSSAVLEMGTNRGIRRISTPPNTLVVFEGARMRHRVTRLGAGERRMLLSMTFGTRPESPPLKDLLRRVKDTAYFGVRALWA
jgi:hypothetical protein